MADENAQRTRLDPTQWLLFLKKQDLNFAIVLQALNGL